MGRGLISIEDSVEVRKYTFVVLNLKQPAHDKGTLDRANTFLHKALIQGHIVNSDT